MFDRCHPGTIAKNMLSKMPLRLSRVELHPLPGCKYVWNVTVRHSQSGGGQTRKWLGRQQIHMRNKLSILTIHKMQTLLLLGMVTHMKLGVVCLAHTHEWIMTLLVIFLLL